MTWEDDNRLMEILRRLDIDINRSAVMIMLEDGMLTEERKFDDYVIAKNIAEAIEAHHKGIDDTVVREILTIGLKEPIKSRLLTLWGRDLTRDERAEMPIEM